MTYPEPTPIIKGEDVNEFQERWKYNREWKRYLSEKQIY